MHRTGKIAALLLCLGLAACASEATKRQGDILAPYETDARLGESVRGLLRAHPNHQQAGDGFFYYPAVGPHQEQRMVRIRGRIDTILWLQIQDETVAGNPDDEQQRFVVETERLSRILGPAKEAGNYLSLVRVARWDLPDGEAVEWRLEIDPQTRAARRFLSLGKPPD
jgi:hypothetical protein